MIGVILATIATGAMTRTGVSGAKNGANGCGAFGMRCACRSEKQELRGIRDMAEKEYIEQGALIAEYDRVHVGAPGGARKLMVDAPAADVVEVETVKKWLYRMALNNVGCFLDGDFSVACEEIISRLDGLRRFAKEMKGGEQA